MDLAVSNYRIEHSQHVSLGTKHRPGVYRLIVGAYQGSSFPLTTWYTQTGPGDTAGLAVRLIMLAPSFAAPRWPHARCGLILAGALLLAYMLRILKGRAHARVADWPRDAGCYMLTPNGLTHTTDPERPCHASGFIVQLKRAVHVLVTQNEHAMPAATCRGPQIAVHIPQSRSDCAVLAAACCDYEWPPMHCGPWMLSQWLQVAVSPYDLFQSPKSDQITDISERYSCTA